MKLTTDILTIALTGAYHQAGPCVPLTWWFCVSV